MIIEAILTALFAVINFLVSLFNFPPMPEQLVTPLESFTGYLQAGCGMLGFFFSPGVLKATLVFIVSLFAIEKLIDLFLWVWRTLHGTNVSEE